MIMVSHNMITLEIRLNVNYRTIMCCSLFFLLHVPPTFKINFIELSILYHHRQPSVTIHSAPLHVDLNPWLAKMIFYRRLWKYSILTDKFKHSFLEPQKKNCLQTNYNKRLKCTCAKLIHRKHFAIKRFLRDLQRNFIALPIII